MLLILYVCIIPLKLNKEITSGGKETSNKKNISKSTLKGSEKNYSKKWIVDDTNINDVTIQILWLQAQNNVLYFYNNGTVML